MAAEVDRRILFVPVHQEKRRAVVYGIAHAGAGAAPWKPVAEAMPTGIELRGIRLPARENRLAVPIHQNLDTAADEIATAIAADAYEPELPRFLIGSCFGALVAVAVAARVTLTGLIALRQPKPLQMTAGGVNLAGLTSAELRQWVLDNRLTPPVVLDKKYFPFYEPILRADFELIDGYAAPGGSLTCPVHVFHCPLAMEDPDLAAWGGVTTGPVILSQLEVEGDPLTDHPDELAWSIANALSSDLDVQEGSDS